MKLVKQQHLMEEDLGEAHNLINVEFKFTFATEINDTENQEIYEFMRQSIGDAINNNVKLKFTAGLHHPIRHFNEQIGTKMHGFVNVFGAALLFYTNKINKNTLIEALEDENPNNFNFKNSSFSWKNNSLPVKEIVVLRDEALLSYGSCSFDEPRDDLKDLGWM